MSCDNPTKSKNIQKIQESQKSPKVKKVKKVKKNKASTSEKLAIQAPWTSTMMKTWQTSVMCNPSIQMLCLLRSKFLIYQISSIFTPPLDLDQHEGNYPIHAFGHLLTSISPLQNISTYPLFILPSFHLPPSAFL